jgi:crotonobetainyl-CoA:carnitine CoA-transferase CaiB-like acyl-CoA transferase
MGSPAWAKDAKFGSAAGRKEHEAELEQGVNGWTAEKDAQALMEELQRVGVPAGVVQSAREMLGDVHLKERGYYVYLDHPEAGRTAYDGPPYKLSKTPGQLRSPAPLLGQHTEQVCKEVLGLSDEEIADLMVAGVLQ